MNKNIFPYMLCKHFLYYLTHSQKKITSKQTQQLLKPTAIYRLNDPFKFIHDYISL